MKTATASNSGEDKQVKIDFEAKEFKEIDVTPVKKTRAPKVPRVPKVKPEKFEMSPGFKKTLVYVKSVGNETMGAIVDRILSKKTVTEDGINFVGISSADSTKISFLDKARSDKFKNEVAPTLFLKEGSVFRYLAKRRISQFWGDPATYSEPEVREVPVTKTNLKLASRENCPPIKVTVKSDLEVVRTPDEDGFYKTEDLVFNFQGLIESESNSLQLHRGRSRSYSYEILTTNPSSGNMQIYGSDYNPKSDLKLKPVSVDVKKVWDPKIRYDSTPGKLLRKLFGTEYTDKELSDFSDLFREYGSVGIPGYTFREEVGEKIRENYLDENYLSGGAGLNSSCMRYGRCQPFFDLYVNSPNTRLATLYYHKKVAARALVWLGEGETYVDRVYSANTQADGIIKNIVRKYKSIYNIPEARGTKVKISREFMENLETVPYMDTLYYYDLENEVLTNVEPKGPHYYMRNQHGNIVKKLEHCSCCGNLVSDNYNYYVYDDALDCLVRADSPICNNCVYHVETINEDGDSGYILRSEAVSPSYGETTHRRLLVTLVDGSTASRYNPYLREYENGYGYFMRNIDYAYNEHNGKYFHLSDPANPSNIQISEPAIANTSTTTIESSYSMTTSSTLSATFSIEEEDDAF